MLLIRLRPLHSKDHLEHYHLGRGGGHTLAMAPLTKSGGLALFAPTPRKMMGGLFGDIPLFSLSLLNAKLAADVQALYCKSRLYFATLK